MVFLTTPEFASVADRTAHERVALARLGDALQLPHAPRNGFGMHAGGLGNRLDPTRPILWASAPSSRRRCFSSGCARSVAYLDAAESATPDMPVIITTVPPLA